MDARIFTILSGINALSRSRGWTNAVALTDYLLSPSRVPLILIISLGDVHLSDIQTWIDQNTPNLAERYQIKPLAFSGIGTNHSDVICADKVVVALECGRLVDPRSLEFLNKTFFTRPSGTNAVIMTGAERIHSPEDLVAVESVAKGALIPVSQPTLANELLINSHVYLWSAVAPIEWMTLRLHNDMTVLRDWLQTVPDASVVHKLEIFQAQYAVETAMKERGSVRQPQSQPDSLVKINESRQSIDILLNRLKRDLETQYLLLQKLLDASLLTLENELVYGWQDHLARTKELRRDRYVSEEELRNLVVKYVSEQAVEWENNAYAQLAVYPSQIIKDSEAFFDRTDWSLINQLVAQDGKNVIYPTALLQKLNVTDPGDSIALKITESNNQELRLETVGSFKSWGRIIVTSGVVMLVSTVVTQVWYGAILAGLLGAIGGYFVDHIVRSGNNRAECERYGKQVIHESIRLTSADAQEFIQQIFQGLIETIDREFAPLFTLLDSARQNTAKEDIDTNTDMGRLQEYLEEISTL